MSRAIEDCATFERVNGLLEYNPFTGKISRKVSSGRHGRWKAGTSAGCLSGGYNRIQIDGKSYKAHRIAHLLMTGNWPERDPEHANQKGVDNIWKNIKDVAPQHDNQGNRGLQVNNISGLRGVRWNRARKKWYVQIQVYGRRIHLGSFDSRDDAGLIWDAAARLVWIPRFQHLNHPGITAHHIVLNMRALRQIDAAMASPAVEQVFDLAA
jgi:hypothetical protein